MHQSIRLISRPAVPKLCSLLCATYSDEIKQLAQQSHYIIEDEDGKQQQLFAHNDEACYRKIVKKWMHQYEKSNKTNFFLQ